MFTTNPVHTPRKLAWDCLLVALFSVFATSVATAQGVHEKVDFTEPFNLTLPVVLPCLQESVRVTGTLRVMIQSTIDGKGGYHEKGSQVVKATGLGLESGDTYRVSGPLSYTLYTPDGLTARVEHFHNVILHVVGPGDDYKVLLLETLHVTTNANGEITVERPLEFEARCPTA